MDIQNRVVNYYKNNNFIQKYLKGIDPTSNEVVLNFNNENRRVGIDSLENIKSEEELVAFFQGRTVQPEVTAVSPELNLNTSNEVSTPDLGSVSINPVSTEQPVLNTEQTNETLDDIKILVELKNKEGLDNVLKKFAVNPSTGLIDINTAISKVTRNTMDAVEEAIRNSYDFSTDARMYDVEGKFIGNPTVGASSEDEQIAKSFNNIKVYIEVSKMYPEQTNYNDEQVNNFLKTYISKVKEELHGAEKKVEPAVEQTPVPPVAVESSPEVSSTASAGFADIFVLTIIVLVYAAIIINLILKLK